MNNGNSDPIIWGYLGVIGAPYKFYEFKLKEYDSANNDSQNLTKLNPTDLIHSDPHSRVGDMTHW